MKENKYKLFCVDIFNITKKKNVLTNKKDEVHKI